MNYVSPFDDQRRVPEPLAPRPGDLSGARIALLDINKRRGDEFLDHIEQRLQETGAQTFRITKQIFSKPAGPDVIRAVAGRGDLAVEALAD
jgi:hypothetical protein